MKEKITENEIKYRIQALSSKMGTTLKWINSDYSLYKNKSTKLVLQDLDGYLYYANIDNISEVIRGDHPTLNKYSKFNIYSIDNINNLLKSYNSAWRVAEGQTYYRSDKKIDIVNGNEIRHIALAQMQYKLKKDNELYFSHNIRRTAESYKKEVSELTNGEYQVVDNYINVDTPILMKHNVCGKIWKVSPYSFVGMGTRCRYCRGIRDTQEEANQELEEATNGEYSIVSGYVNKTHKCVVRHNVCKHEWSVSWQNVVRYHFCPNCVSSYGEKLVRNYCTSNKIDFVEQKRFVDCRDKYPLPYDFYLTKYNLCIEVQGEQHYFPSSFGSNTTDALAKLQYIQKHDIIKKEYCINHQINFLEIKYDELKNVDKIINQKIKEIIEGGKTIL